MLKKCFFYIFVLVCGVVSVQAQQVFVAQVSGAQIVPPILTSAKAICKLRFNDAQSQAELVCQHQNLNSPEGVTLNIHGNGGVGEDAPVIVSFQIPILNQVGTFTRNFPVSPNQFAQIRANKNYITIRASPSLSLRGQIHLANSAYNDFDGDGRTDLTVYRNSNNTFYTQFSLDREVFGQRIGEPGDSVSLTLDFNGDGVSEFSTARYNAPIIWRFSSVLSAVYEVVWGSSALNDFFAAADYDGDGAADIAVFRAGTWYIIESTTGNFRTDVFGRSGDVPAPNDYDLDGKADLAVARSESGQRVWYVRRGSDNQFYRVEWGLSSDAYFAGRCDFDADGAADFLVIRNESGQRVFYIRRSSDSQMQVIRWGLSSDLPKLGDYDGDGKTDAAVTRTVDGLKVFYILQSSNNQTRAEYFGLPGDF